MTDQPESKPKKVTVKRPAKFAKPILNPDLRLGTQDAQIQMHTFLKNLNSNERTTLESFLSVFKPGTPCFNNGYRKMIRYTKFWFQSNGKAVELD